MLRGGVGLKRKYVSKAATVKLHDRHSKRKKVVAHSSVKPLKRSKPVRNETRRRLQFPPLGMRAGELLKLALGELKSLTV